MAATSAPNPKLWIIVGLPLAGTAWGFWAAIEADIRRQQRDWVKCGKRWGHPCNCPEGRCQCGLRPGYSCLNCRPMDGSQ